MLFHKTQGTTGVVVSNGAYGGAVGSDSYPMMDEREGEVENEEGILLMLYLPSRCPLLATLLTKTSLT